MKVHDADGGDPRSSGADPRELAFRLLESYLETQRGDDRDPTFVWSRSDEVDNVLCRWAFEKAEVSGELLRALKQASTAAAPGAESIGWVTQAARRLDEVTGLQVRLNAYLHALRGQREIEPDVDPEGDTLTLDNDIPVYVCVPAGVCRKLPSASSARRLQGVVGAWERGRRGTATRLLSLGPLLSNEDASLPSDDLIERTLPLMTRAEPGAVEPAACVRAPGTSSLAAPAQAAPAQVEAGDRAGAAHPIRWATKGAFEHRLEEELGRSRREGGSVSVVLVQILNLNLDDRWTTALAGELIAGCLRVYDVVSSQDTDELLLFLPGADRQACASVVARIRQRMSAEEASSMQLCLGTATFPGEGGTSQELLACATRACEQDRQRLVCGTIEMGSVPACMVEQITGRQDLPTTIWLGGVPIRMPVRVLQSEQGVRLKLPLSFLRKGVSFRLDLAHGQQFSGVLRDAILSRYKSADEAPVVYLEIERRSVGSGGQL